MIEQKTKHLDNYQLYTLIESPSIDEELRLSFKKELKNRNLSNFELQRLKNKYQLNQSSIVKDKGPNHWDPLWTGFFWSYHFRQIALLKTKGNKKEAESYQAKFYLGLTFYFVVMIILIFLLK